MGDDQLYGYDLKKTMLPGFLTKGVRIDHGWVRRCKRYIGETGCDLKRLVLFIQNGLRDRRREGWGETALVFDEDGDDTPDGPPLSVAQQWIVLHLVLKDGVPDWVRDESRDEKMASLVQVEPEDRGVAG